MALNQRDQRALILGIGLIAAAVLYRFALRPGYVAWADARAVIAANQQQLDTLEQRIIQRDALRTRLTRKYGPAATLELRSIDDARIELPRAVQDALGAAGMGVGSVELQSVRKLREPALQGVSMVSVRVQGSCPGEALPAVLAALRTAPMLILLDEAQLDKTQGADQAGGGRWGGRGGGGGGGGGQSDQSWTLNLLLSTPAKEGA